MLVLFYFYFVFVLTHFPRHTNSYVFLINSHPGQIQQREESKTYSQKTTEAVLHCWYCTNTKIQVTDKRAIRVHYRFNIWKP